jgi:hypothetical protein
MPLVLDEALVVDTRALLCRNCVSAILGAAALEEEARENGKSER